MSWTQKHSRNAVAKKERLRMDRAVAKPADETQSCYKPRKSSPDFTINIRTARGERMQISVWRINGRVVLSDGIKSVRQLCRGIEHLITKSA